MRYLLAAALFSALLIAGCATLKVGNFTTSGGFNVSVNYTSEGPEVEKIKALANETMARALAQAQAQAEAAEKAEAEKTVKQD